MEEQQGESTPTSEVVVVEVVEGGLFPFERLPEELKYVVFNWLSVRDLGAAIRVCHHWHSIIQDQTLWKSFCYRDFFFHVTTEPLPDKEGSFESQESTREVENIFMDLDDDVEELMENLDQEYRGMLSNMLESFRKRKNAAKEDEANKKAKEQEEENEKEKKEKERNWKEFYQACSQIPNLGGYWIGGYGSHGDEYIEVLHQGYDLQGTKLTGDPNVPAGKVSFKVRMNREGKKGKGKIHLADTGYRNPRWGCAYVVITDADHFTVQWYYGPYSFQHYDTLFHRIPEIPAAGWAKIKEEQEREKERERKQQEEEEKRQQEGETQEELLEEDEEDAFEEGD